LGTLSRVLTVSSDRIAAVCAGLLAIATVAFTLTNAFLPAGIYDDPAVVLFQVGSHPDIYRLFFAEWAATGILGLAIIGPVTRLVAGRGNGWAEWASKLGYLAYAVTAIQGVHMVVSVPGLGDLYQGCHTCTASLPEQQTIAKWIYVNAALDPFNFIVAGALGLWILGISAQGLLVDRSPKGLLAVGIITGVLLLAFVVLGAANLPTDILLLVASVAAVIWYAWVGMGLFGKPSTTAV
jgi:hypothetical protein